MCYGCARKLDGGGDVESEEFATSNSNSKGVLDRDSDADSGMIENCDDF